jgi:hypothetical protein
MAQITAMGKSFSTNRKNVTHAVVCRIQYAGSLSRKEQTFCSFTSDLKKAEAMNRKNLRMPIQYPLYYSEVESRVFEVEGGVSAAELAPITIDVEANRAKALLNPTIDGNYRVINYVAIGTKWTRSYRSRMHGTGTKTHFVHVTEIVGVIDTELELTKGDTYGKRWMHVNSTKRLSQSRVYYSVHPCCGGNGQQSGQVLEGHNTANCGRCTGH